VKIAKTPTKRVAKSATAKEATVIAPAKEVAEADQDAKRPAEIQPSAEIPEQSLPESSPGILRDQD
jgi:hypothetical protein